MPPLSTITIKQLAVLKNCSYRTAQREYDRLRQLLGVKWLHAQQLAAAWSVPLDDLAAALGYAK